MFVYDECVHWKANVFMVPFGSPGAAFVGQLARLEAGFATGSSL